MVPSFPRTPHWPDSLSKHRDDLYHEDPAWFVGRPVVMTEKIDGGNAAINQGDAYARSTGEETHLPWFSYLKSVTLPKLWQVPEHLCLYGEDAYAVHSIEYEELPDSFFLFHVLDLQTERFWSWDQVVGYAEELGVLHVPVFFRGTFDSIDDITQFLMRNINEPSAFGPIREGFVIRDELDFLLEDFKTHVCKFVRRNHVQTTEHWTRHWKPAKIRKPA